MNIDEILTIQASDQMDTLIAEKVMGFTFNWEFDNSINVENKPLPHYSTDMSAAWEVVEKLCNETGCDVVKVCKRDPELLRGEWSCNFGRGFEAFGETAPLAICRAALLSVYQSVNK